MKRVLCVMRNHLAVAGYLRFAGLACHRSRLLYCAAIYQFKGISSMKTKSLLLAFFLTVPVLAFSAELGKLVEAVDTDKAAESVDTEKLKDSVDGTDVDYKKALDSVDKKKAADSVDMDKVKEALTPDASDVKDGSGGK